MRTILVIDDDPDFVEFVRIVLESVGYQVLCAYNAEQGLALMRDALPDLVLLDMLMSYSMDGLNVTRTMREDVELSGIPLIVVSAILSGPHAMPGENGASPFVTAFLTKPIEPGDLLRKVAEVLSQQRE